MQSFQPRARISITVLCSGMPIFLSRTHLMRGLILLLLHVVLRAGALSAQTHQSLDAVTNALGGKSRLLGIRTLQLEGRGRLLYFGQTETPYGSTNFTVTAFERAYDFSARRWQQTQLRESRFLTPIPEPLRVRIGLDSGIAYNVIGKGPMTRAAAVVAADRAAEFFLHPVGFIQAAYAPTGQVTESTHQGTERIQLRIDSMAFVMDVDAATHLPRRISRVVDHQMLGDVTMELHFSNWVESGGVKLPMRVVQKMERWILSDYSFTRARINADTGDLQASSEVRSSTLAPVEPEMPIRVDEVATGVWLLTGPPFNGAEYHTVAIEQSNQIVLVEAPENDARTLAVINAAKSLRFGKPVTTLVNTHAHFDHAGGIRAAVESGLRIVTDQRNREFLERVYRGRHTLRPDALSRSPKALSLMSVARQSVLRDALRPIELVSVEGDGHSGSMLAVYLPTERMLIHADLDQATSDGQANGPPIVSALMRAVTRHRLRVEHVVGIHGDPVAWRSPFNA